MKIKYVDAADIRNTLDTNFSGWGTHRDYFYVPLGELWVDHYLKNELDLIKALVDVERRLVPSPMHEIRAEAKRLLTDPDLEIATLRQEKCGRLTVKYVDGATVRRSLDPYFLCGGHDLVYAYIPKNEIWVDASGDPAEMRYTLIHEMDERSRMAKGMSYDDAHDFAIATERAARRKDGVSRFLGDDTDKYGHIKQKEQKYETA